MRIGRWFALGKTSVWAPCRGMSLQSVCGRDDAVGVAASARAAPVVRVMLCFWVCRFPCNHHLDICQVVVIDVALAYRSEPCTRWLTRLNLVAAPYGEQCMLFALVARLRSLCCFSCAWIFFSFSSHVRVFFFVFASPFVHPGVLAMMCYLPVSQLFCDRSSHLGRSLVKAYLFKGFLWTTAFCGLRRCCRAWTLSRPR